MGTIPVHAPDSPSAFEVHLLDVGRQKYGDAVLCRFDGVTVLIDGAHPSNTRSEPGHPSIPEQLGDLLGKPEPYEVDLLIVSHAHQDHIGCLPALVEKDVLRARWALVVDPDFGWGIAADADASPMDAVAPGVRQLVAALREERQPEASDGDLEAMMADAANLEDNYRRMLKTLKARGTKVVRHHRDSLAGINKSFKGIGLKVLGPSQEQVLRCAERIAQATDEAIDQAEELFQQDAALDPVEAYRRLMPSADTDDAADASRFGPAINLQSIVVRFEFAGKKILFAGDMQFSKPGVGDEGIKTEVASLREAVEADGPFAFAKLSHHGAQNAVDADLLNKMAAPVLGICAGEESNAHPNAVTLGLLKARLTDGLRWARTDRNGLSTISFEGPKAKIEVTRGKINDTRPPSADEAPAPELAAKREMQPAFPAPVRTAITSSDADFVEVVTRIPRRPTRVVVTIDVEPRDAEELSPPSPRPASRTEGTGKRRETDTPLLLAGGRALPKLLFVTSRAVLADNIGQAESNRVLAALRAAGAEVLDDLPRVFESSGAHPLVRERLRALGEDVRGVVIIGGHDVVPSQRLDCLSPELRRRLKRPNKDHDNFIVWSDDIYGDRDGDGLPEVPVSRIPDGRSSQLVLTAIQAPDAARDGGRCGVRNVARPFAEGVFKALPGTRALLVSEPTEAREEPRMSLDSDLVYLMLHGNHYDLSVFTGEPDGIEAVNIANIPPRAGRVVFTGCCWGALTVDTLAVQAGDGRPVAQRVPEASLALTFLARGATAFVGCTGVHYSPLMAPYNFYGGPMHHAFWDAYLKGSPPAQALHEAKIEYLKGIPHKGTDAGAEAIERKILRQYTCLGLGW